jgi:hypothetical protein
LPNRRDTAGCNPTFVSALEAHFGANVANDGGIQQLTYYALTSASSFMNFCQALSSLAAQPPHVAANTWKDLVAQLTTIIKTDVNTDFIPAAGFALANLCGTAPTTVSGPAASLPAGTSLGVTLTY